MATKKLTRSANNKMLAGVCGGLAEYFGVDATLVRIIYAVLAFFTTGFPGLLLYIILMLIMPVKQDSDIEDVEYVEAKDETQNEEKAE
jgi:phage shock protein C